MTTLLLATRNAHKVGEIRSILGERFRYLSLKDFPNAPEVAEDAPTFAGNALKKAVGLARWLARGEILAQGFVLADDSGLEVDALHGAPGVHSARFSALETGRAGNAPDAENNAKLIRLLKEIPPDKRTARFHCVIALTPVLATAATNASPVCSMDDYEARTELFEGTCEGRISHAPAGTGGFGYDPFFIPMGCQQSFAELGEADKNRLSHRGQSLAKLRLRLEAIGG